MYLYCQKFWIEYFLLFHGTEYLLNKGYDIKKIYIYNRHLHWTMTEIVTPK